MSHITNGKLRIKNLDALEEAAPHLGLILKRGQTTHKWYGRFVGDTTPPAGLDPDDYGKCSHALVLANASSGDYEIGVVKALDGGEGFDLVLDTWQQHRLMAAVGLNMNRLRQEYAAAVALRNARKTLRGYTATREQAEGGRIRLRLQRR